MQSGHSSGPSFSNPTRSIYFSRPALDPLLEEDFYITREDLEILAEYIDEFQDADAEMWTTIVANAMAELAILWDDSQSFDKVIANEVSLFFLTRLGVHKLPICSRKLENGFTITIHGQNDNISNLLVNGPPFYHMHRDQIMKKVEELSGSLPGSSAFLACLQDATTQLWNKLSDNNQDLYFCLAKKWWEEGPPPDIQARYVMHTLSIMLQYWYSSRMASSISPQIIWDFQMQLFRSCRLWCIVLTAHKNENAQIVTGLWVLQLYVLPDSAIYRNDIYKSAEEGPSFLSSCPDWRTIPLWKAWQQYAKKSFQGGS